MRRNLFVANFLSDCHYLTLCCGAKNKIMTCKSFILEPRKKNSLRCYITALCSRWWSDSGYVPKAIKIAMFHRKARPMCRILIWVVRKQHSWLSEHLRCFFFFFVGEGRSELVLRRDSVWPSTASCDSQGVWRRFSHQAPAAHSTTSPFCDQCAAWTNNAGWIHNLGRTPRSLSKGPPACGLACASRALSRCRYHRKCGRTSVPVCACRIAIAACSLCKVWNQRRTCEW